MSSHTTGLLGKQKSEAGAKRAQHAPDTKSGKMKPIMSYVAGRGRKSDLSVKKPGNG